MSANELAIPFVYASEVYAAAITLPIVAAAAVALRFISRRSRKVGLGWDDFTICLALLPLVGMAICLIYGTAQGAIGYPSTPYPVNLGDPLVEELTETTREQDIVFQMDWIIWLLMIPSNGLIKLSALFLYRRLFVVNSRTVFDIVSKCVIGVSAVWTAGFWFAQLFGCGKNFGAPFSNLLAVSSCNTNVRLDALMITDLLTDLIVWVLPIPMVWQLQMSASKKIGITGIFCLAAVSLAAAIVRLIVQEEISNGGYAAHTDVNLTLTILLYWSMLESGLALIAACLPTLHLVAAGTSLNSVFSSVKRLLSSKGSQTEAPVGTSQTSWEKLSDTGNKNRNYPLGPAKTSLGAVTTRREEHETQRYSVAV